MITLFAAAEDGNRTAEVEVVENDARNLVVVSGSSWRGGGDEDGGCGVEVEAK